MKGLSDEPGDRSARVTSTQLAAPIRPADDTAARTARLFVSITRIPAEE